MTIPRTASLVLLLCATVRGTGQEKPANNVLLPSFAKAEPVREAVFFAFDTASFPERKNVSFELIQGRTRAVCSPPGSVGGP